MKPYEDYAWEARAEYENGISVERLFAYDEHRNEDDQQYDIECWLLGRHPNCTWYSVTLVSID